MVIEIFADGITKDDVKELVPHVGARAIVKKDDQYLLAYLKKDDFYTLPGGGVEQGESIEAAVVREVKEETGYLCKVMKKGVTLKEYFPDSVWHHHFFVLEVISQTDVSLTEEEKALELVAVWKSFEEVLQLFTESDSPHENAETIHNREFLGFTQSL